MEENFTVDDLVKPGAVHRDIYRSPQVFALEMERIFKRSWVFIGHESEVSEPGDYKTLQIGLEPVIFVRDEAGELAVLVNRCRHRAATVCQSDTGNATTFRCHYHGWTYRCNGQLVGVPHPKRYEEDLRQTLGLQRLPRVESYRGLVFASFNERVATLEEYIGKEALAYVDIWLDHCGSDLIALSEDHKLKVEANWKLQMENGLDGYHATFTHRSFFELMQERTGASVRFASSLPNALTKSFEHGHAVVDPASTSNKPLVSRIAALPHAEELLAELRTEVGDEEYDRLLECLPGPGVNIGIFPNLQLIGIHVRRIEPIAPRESVVTVRPMLLKDGPPTFNELRVRYHEMFYGPAGFGQPDDVEMFVRVERGLEDSSDEWVLLTRGLNREDHEGDALVGHVSDETPQRGQYREWTRLMEIGA